MTRRRVIPTAPRPVRPIERETITFRTLHPFDRRRELKGGERPPFTLDGVVQVSVARVEFREIDR